LTTTKEQQQRIEKNYGRYVPETPGDNKCGFDRKEKKNNKKEGEKRELHEPFLRSPGEISEMKGNADALKCRCLEQKLGASGKKQHR